MNGPCPVPVAVAVPNPVPVPATVPIPWTHGAVAGGEGEHSRKANR